jgi:hypothetical protein
MYAWLLEITVLVLILLVWLTQYKRFIPLEMPPEQKVSTIIAPPKQEGSDSSLEEDLEDKDAHNYGRF